MYLRKCSKMLIVGKSFYMENAYKTFLVLGSKRLDPGHRKSSFEKEPTLRRLFYASKTRGSAEPLGFWNALEPCCAHKLKQTQFSIHKFI